MRSTVLGLLAVGLTAVPMSAQAAGVVVDGREWRQLTETPNLSWYQIATVCDTTTGACNGSLETVAYDGATWVPITVAFDGWTWAANSDIQSLFESLILPGSIQFPTSTSDYREMDSPDISAAARAPYFEPSWYYVNRSRVWGWSRTEDSTTTAYSPFLENSFSDSARLSFSGAKDYMYGPYFFGAWLYRSVPEPGTLALLSLGLAGLGLSRRRRAN